MTAVAERARAVETVGPQPGFQTAFCSSCADIAIGGGSAYSGKTFAELLIYLQHVGDPDARAVFFRRTLEEIKDEGGLWEVASRFYGRLGATSVPSRYRIIFPSGAVARFAHMEYESDRYRWKGAQVPVLFFDQLETFTELQFWYVVGHANRSPRARIWPYTRGSVNPDPDSFLRELLAWWIDDETGLAIPERSGVLRWLRRRGDTLDWYDEPGEGRLSITYIPGSPYENRIGIEADPDYIETHLGNLPEVEKQRLLYGNWNARPHVGDYMRGEMFRTVGAAPSAGRAVRGWDLASLSEEEAKKDSPWTVGLRMRHHEGRFYIEDVRRQHSAPDDVDLMIDAASLDDGPSVMQDFPTDPGQAGKYQANFFAKLLAGRPFQTSPEAGDRFERGRGFISQARAGNVFLVAGPWNAAFRREMESIAPGAKIMDQYHAALRSMNALVGPTPKRKRIGVIR